MFAIAAVAKRAVQNMRGQAVAAETGGGTQVDQALDPWSLGRDITAAQGGRQCFGKTAYLYYAGQPIQCRQSGSGSGLQIPENIVLNNVEVGALRHGQHAMGRHGRKTCAGWIVYA
uniref:Uncharacterized protein n=1 Tax=Panagrolaimus superbus TaxID=310955 RepID=A0A914Y5E7_9BILA